MSKLNPTIKRESKFSTQRLAGGSGALAAKQDAESLLRRAVMACLLWEDLFYSSGTDNSENIAKLIAQVDPQTVAEIAIEARVAQKLRHVPLYIASEMLKHPKHREYVGEVLPRVITRADQLTDFLSLYWKVGTKEEKKTAIASQVKKGLADAFHNFNEYKLAKYDRDSKIKLRDVMRLVHPKPRNAAESELFDKVIKRTLDVPDTWEVALSAGRDKKATWERLILEGKLGALAFLRNLSNMTKAGVDHNIIRQGFETIYSSMLLPLNFTTAAAQVPVFKADIEKMMLRAYAGLPKLTGYTIFVVDVSGSMGAGISGKTAVTRMGAASAMAVLAANQCENIDIYCTAGSDGAHTHRTEKIAYPQMGFGLIEQIDQMKSRLGGGGIFTRQCLEFIATQTTKTPDRIIIFSDSQDCDYPHLRVPKPFGKNNYIVDVSAEKHGVNYKGVWTAEISGMSDHFLTYIASLEGLQNTFEDDDSLQ
jgi:hypothetical protein